MSLTFDPVPHEYKWNNIVVPGVTETLERMQSFAGVSRDVMEAAQLRGSMVHLMAQYHDEDCLDESQFTAEELSYLPGWKKFIADHKPNWTAIERPFYNTVYGYAGTPDREGDMEWRDGRFDSVIDIKTAVAKHPVWPLQLAAYDQGKRRRRGTVQLASDGTYRLLEWPDASDFPIFVAAVTLNRWVRKNLKAST